MSRIPRASLVIKHTTDWVIAGTSLLLLAPALAAIALGVKLTSPGPIFFRQERVGLKGRLFLIWKFRSMAVDAMERAGGHVTRLDSPLVTPFGRFLRVSSLDELPQLINVVRGEMSLVGPRPLLQGTIHASEMRRQDMRPGCTGLAAVNGRQGLDWERRLELDLWYVDHWSLWLDLKVVVKTIPAVLFAKNISDSRGEMKARPGTDVHPK